MIREFFQMGAPAAFAIGAASFSIVGVVAIRTIRGMSRERDLSAHALELEKLRRDRVKEIDTRREPD